MLNSKWEEPLLTQILEAERDTSTLGHSFCWKKEAFALCPLALAWIAKSIPSLALEPSSPAFQRVLKSGGDMLCGLSNFCILEPSIHKQPLLD